MLAELHFLRPLWLLLLLPVCWLAWLPRARRRTSALERICDPELLDYLQVAPATRRSGPRLLILLCAVLLTLALAGPSLSRAPQPALVEQRVRVLILDLSDRQPPAALARYKRTLRELTARGSGDTSALILFAGAAYEALPLSRDSRAIRALIPQLSPGIMPEQGWRPERALALAERLLARNNARAAEVMLLSGNDLSPERPEIRQLEAQGHRVRIVAPGAPLPAGAAPAAAGASDAVPRGRLEWQDRGPWLLLAVLPLAALLFRRGWLFAWVLLVLPPAPDAWADVPNAPSPQPRAQEAVQHYRAGRYREALAGWSRGGDAESFYNRGNALVQLQRYRLATLAYREALTLDPGHEDAAHNLALVERFLAPPESPPGAGGGSDTPQKSSGGGATGEQAPPDLAKWLQGAAATDTEFLRQRLAAEHRRRYPDPAERSP